MIQVISNSCEGDAVLFHMANAESRWKVYRERLYDFCKANKIEGWHVMNGWFSEPYSFDKGKYDKRLIYHTSAYHKEYILPGYLFKGDKVLIINYDTIYEPQRILAAYIYEVAHDAERYGHQVLNYVDSFLITGDGKDYFVIPKPAKFKKRFVYWMKSLLR